MNAPASIDALLRNRPNEDPHTEQVTRLTLELFDRTRSVLGLNDSDRAILHAAGRLHDIGYSMEPRRHPDAGAAFVREHPIAGLDDFQRKMVAAIIALHPKNLEKAKKSPFFQEAPDQAKALQLGAMLRVGDGLDHSHIQDASITRVDPQRDTLTVTVRSEWYSGNVPWARQKSDLWNEVFPLKLNLENDVIKGKRPLFAGVVHPGDSVLEAARRILYSQYRIFTDSREGALLGENPEHLHDIRVALRRFRAAIDLFKPRLKKTSARDIDHALDRLGDKLGPVRDLDVWLQFLEDAAESLPLSDRASWENYIVEQRTKRDRAYDRLRVLLGDHPYNALAARMAHFLRMELPNCLRHRKHTPLLAYGAPILSSTFDRIMKHRKSTRDESAEEMHDLRRLCRKERYWAEFLAPAMGDRVNRLARKLKGIADSLGDIHDMDIHLAAAANSSDHPAELVAYMQKLRKKSAGTFRKRWKKLTDSDYRKKVRKSLAKAAKKEG